MYDDIIDIKYPFDLSHKRMSFENRCSQFMPFSALSGYSDAVLETARITDKKIILDDELKEILNNKLNKIRNVLSSNPNVSITYFVPDFSKDGGSYKCISGVVKKIDLYNNIVVVDDAKISIDDIINIDSNCFNDEENM